MIAVAGLLRLRSRGARRGDIERAGALAAGRAAPAAVAEPSALAGVNGSLMTMQRRGLACSCAAWNASASSASSTGSGGAGRPCSSIWSFPRDCARAAASDAVGDTIDYKQVAKRVLAFVGESQYLLIETLAHRLALLLLGEFSLDWVRVDLEQTGRNPPFTRRRGEHPAAPRRPRVGRITRAGPLCRRVYVAIGSNIEPERWFRAGRARAAASLPRHILLCLLPQSRLRVRGRGFSQRGGGFRHRGGRGGGAGRTARDRDPVRPAARRSEMGAARHGHRPAALRRDGGRDGGLPPAAAGSAAPLLTCSAPLARDRARSCAIR